MFGVWTDRGKTLHDSTVNSVVRGADRDEEVS